MVIILRVSPVFGRGRRRATRGGSMLGRFAMSAKRAWHDRVTHEVECNARLQAVAMLGFSPSGLFPCIGCALRAGMSAASAM